MASTQQSLRLEESGQGSPVVLLDWTPWETKALADALASRHRVIGVGLPGAGEDARSAEEVAGTVADMADSAGLDSYALVGASVGADVALRVALLRPASVAVLALVSPFCVEAAAPRPWSTPELAASAMLAHPEDTAHTLPGAARTATLSTLSQRWRSSDAADRLLPDVACATLVVFGQEDRLVSRGAGGVWKERVSNCNVCYVYDAGHAIAVERPDALLNVVLDFVERRETFIVENRSFLVNP